MLAESSDLLGRLGFKKHVFHLTLQFFKFLVKKDQTFSRMCTDSITSVFAYLYGSRDSSGQTKLQKGRSSTILSNDKNYKEICYFLELKKKMLSLVKRFALIYFLVLVIKFLF